MFEFQVVCINHIEVLFRLFIPFFELETHGIIFTAGARRTGHEMANMPNQLTELVVSSMGAIALILVLSFVIC